jgi:phage baseplate assembly protein W
MITTAINDYEPRVEVLDILTDIKDYADGLVKIEIIYRVRATNTRHNIVFPFYKNEGTSLPEEIS